MVALRLLPADEADFMEIDIHHVRNIMVVSLAGRLDSASSLEVTDRVMPQIADAKSILVDMSEVKYMSSAGLRMLLKLHRVVDNFGGKVVLVGLAETLEEVMSITGFLSFFTVKRSFDEGIAALQMP